MDYLKNEPEKLPELWNIQIPSDFKALLQDVCDTFGYSRLTDAARNCLRVGSRLASENSQEFVRLLNGNA